MGAVRGGSSRQAIAACPAHVVLSPRLGSRDADLLPGDRARRPAGCHRALSSLEPGPFGDLAAAPGLDRRRRRAVGVGVLFPRLPGRPPRGHRARTPGLLSLDLGEDRARTDRVPADPPHRDARPAPRVAAPRGDDPGGVGRPAPRAHPSGRLRQAARGRRAPRHQRPGPAVRRVDPPAGRGQQRRSDARDHDRRRDTLDLREAGAIGMAQVLALLPGISRSGITMVAGLARGLDHEDSARFSFLLATPIILAAGIYKLPDLLGPNGDGVRLQILAGSVAAGLAAYLSVRFLTRYFTTRTLTPFAVYCLVVGILAIVRFA